MLESIQNENLEYQRLSPEEMKARGILGRLVGVCADFQNPTRNGRLYSEELWERVFNDPIMKERIQNGVCYGELGHPEDREETDMEKIAVCLSDVPKKGKDGKLRAVFDIMDTPNGRILKSLCDYGSTLGISSRGSGDLVTGFNGQEEVDPSSYNCEGFDVVLIPAVKEARLQYVNESLNKTRYNKTLRQKLQESLDKASPEDRKVMEEGLDSIGIDLDEELKPFAVEFDYTYETDNKIDYFKGHITVNANSEEEALKKAEEYCNSVEWQNANPNNYNPHNFKITDTIYTNADVVEQLEKTEDEVRKERIESEIEEFEKDADWADEHNNPAGATQARKKIADLREGKIIPPKYRDGDIVFLGDADGYNGSFLIKGDIENVPEELYSVIRRIMKYGNTDEPIYKVEYKLPSNHYFEADYDNFFKEIKPILKSNGINVIVSEDEFTESLKAEVDNNESDLINELQESLKTIKSLKDQVIELQEKLSVCYSKEADQEDEINSLQSTISNLSKVNEKNESLKGRVKSLTETLNKEKSDSSEKDTANKKLKETLNSVVVKYNKLVDVHNELKENYSTANSNNEQLKEELEAAKLENEKLKEDYANKLSNSNALVEKYRKAASSAAEKYIESQAIRIGVSAQEIKNKLPEKYTFNDIDSICESLADYNLNISKLPFQTSRKLNENVKIQATPSKEPILPDGRYDDDVDDLLKLLSGFKH